VPSIKSLFLPCEGDRPVFEARLGKLKVQILIGSAWLRVLGMVLAVPRSGVTKFLAFC